MTAAGVFVAPAAELTMGSALAVLAEAQPSAPCLYEPASDCWQSFGEFNSAVNRLAHALSGLGVGQGQHVTVMLPNCTTGLRLSYALRKLGAVEVMIHASSRGPSLVRAVALTGARVLVTGGFCREPVADVLAHLDHVRTILTLEDDPGHLGKGRPTVVSLDGLPEADDSEPGAAVAPGDPAMIMFTSGTTGISKGCVLSHRYAVEIAEVMQAHTELDQADCVYAPLPLSHVVGSLYDVFATWCAGGRTVVRERFSAGAFWSDVFDHDVSKFSMMGSIGEILMGLPASPRDREHRIGSILTGPAPRDAAGFERRFGIELRYGYGSTEAGYPAADFGHRRAPHGSNGWVLPSHEMKVVGDDGSEVEPGAIGELLVRGTREGVMFSGYFGAPEATAAKWVDGWFRTEDLGSIGADGLLRYAGRRAELIRRRGENVSAWEVEEVVVSHPAVGECVAVGAPSHVGEHDVYVFVVLAQGEQATYEELQAFTAPKLPRYAVPSYYEIVSDLPRTGTEKPDRKALSELAARRVR